MIVTGKFDDFQIRWAFNKIGFWYANWHRRVTIRNLALRSSNSIFNFNNIILNFYSIFISVEQKAEQAYFWKWRRVKYLRVLKIFLILVVIKMMRDLNRSDCGCETNDNHFWISSILKSKRFEVKCRPLFWRFRNIVIFLTFSSVTQSNDPTWSVHITSNDP